MGVKHKPALPYTAPKAKETRMLHPQAQALLRLMEERGVPPTHTLTPEEARAFYRQRRTFTQPDPPQVGAVRELEARGPAGPSRCAATARWARRRVRSCRCSSTTTAGVG
jgi:hypothetical protein